MPNQIAVYAGAVRSVIYPGGRLLRGMPVAVWTMVLWLLAALAADAASFAVEGSPVTPLAPRIVGAVVALLAAAVLLALRERTPTWFLHLLVCAAIAFMVWFVAVAHTTSLALTAMLIMLIAAGYSAYTMSSPFAAAYVALSATGLLGVIVVSDRVEALVLPWAILTVISFVEILLLGMMVSDLKQQVVIDPLTGLLNRAGLELVTSGAEGHRMAPEPRSIVVLDLDNFKAVNDEHGHVQGDRVLIDVGRTIRAVCRSEDIAVRCGGDEFIVLLPKTDAQNAESLAARLQNEVAAPCSTGVAQWEADEALHLAIARADKQMYGQKATRRDPGERLGS